MIIDVKIEATLSFSTAVVNIVRSFALSRSADPMWADGGLFKRME